MKKSSAENKPTGRLEDVFRQQFEQAEVTPPAELWSRLEHDLDVQDKNAYHKGMLRYRNIAAVALLLLLATATLLTRKLLTESEPNGNLAVMQENAGRPEPVSQETKHAARPAAKAGVAEADKPGRTPDQTAARAHQRPQQTAPDELPAGKNTAEKGAFDKAPAGLEPQTYASAAGKRSAAGSPDVKPRKTYSPAAGALALAARPAGRKETSSGSDGGSGAGTTGATAAKKMPEKETAAVAVTTGRPESETNADAAAFARNEQGVAARQETAELVVAAAAPDTSKQQLAALPEAEMPKPDDDKPETKTSKWMLLASATPQMFKQNIMLRPGNGNGVTQNALVSGSGGTFDAAIAEYERETRSSFSYQVQVGAGYRLKPEWILQTGLGFMQNRARSEATYIISRQTGITSNPEVSAPQHIFAVALAGLDSASSRVLITDPYTVHYRYNYVQVPLMLTYEGTRGEWLYQVSAGVAANFLLAPKTSGNNSNNRIETASAAGSYSGGGVFHSFLPQAIGSAKVGFNLNRNWQLTAGPSVAFGLRSMLKESKGDFRPNSTSSVVTLQEIEQKKPVNLGFTAGVGYNFMPKK